MDPTPKQPLRIGLAGVGAMGEKHLQKLIALQSSHVSVAGLFDIQKEKADHMSRTYSVPHLHDLNTLLHEVDALCIASSTQSHAQITQQALEAGVHVLVEKPVGGKPDEIEKLVALAREKQCVFQVGFLERLRLSHMIHNAPTTLWNLVGLPFAMETVRMAPKPGRENLSILWDLLIHDLDLALSLFGPQVTHMQAWGWFPPGASYTHPLRLTVSLDFPQGTHARCVASLGEDRKRECVLYHSWGRQTFNLAQNSLHTSLFAVNADGIPTLQHPTELAHQFDFDALYEQSKQWLASMQSRTPPVCTGKQAYDVCLLAHQIENHLARQKTPPSAPLLHRKAMTGELAPLGARSDDAPEVPGAL